MEQNISTPNLFTTLLNALNKHCQSQSKDNLTDCLSLFDYVLTAATFQPLAEEGCQAILTALEQFKPLLLEQQQHHLLSQLYAQSLQVLRQQAAVYNQALANKQDIDSQLLGLSVIPLPAKAIIEPINIQVEDSYKINLNNVEDSYKINLNNLENVLAEKNTNLIIQALKALILICLLPKSPDSAAEYYKRLYEALQFATLGFSYDENFAAYIDIVFGCFYGAQMQPFEEASGTWITWLRGYNSCSQAEHKAQMLQQLLNAADQWLRLAQLYAHEPNAEEMFLRLLLQQAETIYLAAKKHSIDKLQQHQVLKQLYILWCYKQDLTLLRQEKLLITKPLLPWQTYRKDLVQLRANLKLNLAKACLGDGLKLLQEYNQGLNRYLQDIWQACAESLGNPPCEYAFLGLGSLGRAEACPYSDIEFAILLAKSGKEITQQVYFLPVMRLFELAIVSLGETPLTISNRDNMIPGLRMDDGGNIPLSSGVACKPELLGNREELFWLFPPNLKAGDMVLANCLQGAGLLWGSETLYEAWATELQLLLNQPYTETITYGQACSQLLSKDHAHDKQLKLYENSETLYKAWATELQLLLNQPYTETITYGQACSQLLSKDHAHDKQLKLYENNATELEIKHQLLRIPVFLINTLGISAAVVTPNMLNRLKALVDNELVTAAMAFWLETYLSVSFYLRLAAHLHYGCERETLYLAKSDQSCENPFWIPQQHQSVLMAFRQFLLPVLQQAFVEPTLLQQKIMVPTDTSMVLTGLLQLAYQYTVTADWDKALVYYDVLLTFAEENNIPVTELELIKKYQASVQASYQTAKTVEKHLQKSLQLQGLEESVDTLMELFTQWQTKRTSAHPNHQQLPDYAARLSPKINILLRLICLAASDAKLILHAFTGLPNADYRYGFIDELNLWSTQAEMASYLPVLNSLPNATGACLHDIKQQPQNRWLTVLKQLADEPFKTDQVDNYNKQRRLQVQWVENGKVVTRLLNVILHQQWLDPITGAFKPESRKAADGKRIVVPLTLRQDKVAWAKVFPEMPGIQIAADRLIKALTGINTHTTLCVFTPLAEVNAKQPKAVEPYPVLLSEHVAGVSLQDWQRQQGSLTTLDSQLDDFYYTLKVLEALVLHPEDDKPDNLIAETFVNSHGETKYRLVSIDADHAFVDALLQKGVIQKELKVQVKTIVFCFDKMLTKLHPAAVQLFLNLDIYQLLHNWLIELEALFAGYSKIYTKEDIKRWFNHKPDSCIAPIIFEAGAVKALYERCIRLQAILQDIEQPAQTHLEVLQYMQPTLASFYEQVLMQQLTPEQRFANLPTDYQIIKDEQQIVVYQSQFNKRERIQKSITIAPLAKKENIKQAFEEGAVIRPKLAIELELNVTHHQFQHMQELRSHIQAGQHWQTFAELTPYLQEQIVNRLDWSRVTKPKEWLGFLSKLEPFKPQTLIFKDAIELQNNHLQAILARSRDLLFLRIKNAAKITFNIASYLNQYCNRIKEVTLDGLNSTELDERWSALYAIKPGYFNKLSIKNCFLLTRIAIKNPLQHLELENLPKLQKLELASTQLQYLGLSELNWPIELYASLLKQQASTLLAIDLRHSQNNLWSNEQMLLFPLLETMTLQDRQINTVLLDAPKLHALRVDNCLNLKEIKLPLSYLRTLSANGTQLAEINLSYPWLLRYSSKLKVLVSVKALTWVNQQLVKQQWTIHEIDSWFYFVNVREKKVLQNSLDELLQALQNESGDVRKDAIQALGQLSVVLLSQHIMQEKVLQSLLQALKDMYPGVRQVAAQALGELSAILLNQPAMQESILQGLLQALKDNDRDVRRGAAQALGHLSAVLLLSQTAMQEQVLQGLLQILLDDSLRIRAIAAQVLGQLSCLWKNHAQLQKQMLERLLPPLQVEFYICFDDEAQKLGHFSEVFLSRFGMKELIQLYSERQNQSELQARSLQTLVQSLQDDDLSIRKVATQALGQLSTSLLLSQSAMQEQVLKGLVQALKVKNELEFIRERAVLALGKLSMVLVNQPTMHEQVLEQLLEALEDMYSHVRRSAAQALGQLSAVLLLSQSATQEQVLQRLLQMVLQTWNVSTAAFSAKALGQLSAVLLGQLAMQEQVLQGLLQVLLHKSWDIRASAAQALGLLSPVCQNQPQLQERVLQALLQVLQDIKASVRASAAQALGLLSPVCQNQPQLQEQVLQALLQVLQDNKASVRVAAAQALGQLSAVLLSQPAMQELVLQGLLQTFLQALKDTKAKVCVAAAQALGQLSAVLLSQLGIQEQVLQGLLQALQDTNAKVCVAAIQALGQLSAVLLSQLAMQEPVLQGLLQALQDTNAEVCVVAAQTLGRLNLISQNQPELQAQMLQELLLIPQMLTLFLDLMLLINEHIVIAEWLPTILSVGAYKNPLLLGQFLAMTYGLIWEMKQDVIRVWADTPLKMDKFSSVLSEESFSVQNKFGLKLTLSALILALKSYDNAIRVGAVQALGQLSLLWQEQPIWQEEVLQGLLQVLQDNDTAVRAAAAKMISKWLSSVWQKEPNLQEGMFQKLLQILQDEDWRACAGAAQALSQIVAAIIEPSVVQEFTTWENSQINPVNNATAEQLITHSGIFSNPNSATAATIPADEEAISELNNDSIIPQFSK